MRLLAKWHANASDLRTVSQTTSAAAPLLRLRRRRVFAHLCEGGPGSRNAAMRAGWRHAVTTASRVATSDGRPTLECVPKRPRLWSGMVFGLKTLTAGHPRSLQTQAAERTRVIARRLAERGLTSTTKAGGKKTATRGKVAAEKRSVRAS
jgi:hypothetical protein